MTQKVVKERKIKKGVFKKTTVILAWMVTVFSFAQQDVQYTQYMYNTVTVNPAYAGSRGHMSMAALYRAQWVGLAGAPETQTFNFHTPVGYRGLGLGVSFLNDIIGPTSETNFDVDFSYTIPVGYDAKLSFGLKGSAHLLDVQFSQLDQDLSQGPDETLQQDIDNRFSPNIGAGIYYHTERYYAGLSIPRMLETEHFEESSLSTARERMNWYFITGYVWDLNTFLKFKPTLLTKWVQGAPLQVDVSANFMLNNRFIAGVAYRWDAAFSGMFGFQISERLMFGLSYDRDVTDLGGATFNDGSFEIIFRYDFIRSRGNLKSPRFF